MNSLLSASGNLDKQTEWGNTALHYCCMYEKPECLKLLLRGKPATDISQFFSFHRSFSLCNQLLDHPFRFPLSANQNGETALDVARRLRNTQCEEAVSAVYYIFLVKKKSLFAARWAGVRSQLAANAV